jgi:arylsulfatase A
VTFRSVSSVTYPLMKNLALAILCLLAPLCPLQAAKPNIIVILADDLGYGDLGCYGSQVIRTPHLDRMASEGVRFTDFYVASSFCSPSRAALLTGKLPARCGVPYVLFPAEHTGLPQSETTLAEVLKPAGYATACVGKWHLGWRKELRPREQGFDEFYGLLHTNDITEWEVGEPFHQLSSYEPLQLRDGDRVIEAPVDQTTITQRYTKSALDFIRRNREQPFFLYLAHTMPHIPQHASADFAGKSKDGVFGDCVEELDWSTGRILDMLRELRLAENTLVLFTSDNGAGLRGKKPQAKEPFPGRSMAGSNGVLRGGKGSTFEGGVRVPCIAWWPKTLPAGRVDGTPWSTLDFMPTFAGLLGKEMPDVDGIDFTAGLKGREVRSEPRLILHYFGVQLQAVREGPWKLFVPITELPKQRVPSLWFEHQAGVFERQHRLWPKPMLYDLSSDTGEKNDVAEAHPEVVERLLRKAREHDESFQKQIPTVQYLPGPKPPAPGQIRTAKDDVSEWLRLMH